MANDRLSIGGWTEPQDLVRRVYEAQRRIETELPASALATDIQVLLSDLGRAIPQEQAHDDGPRCINCGETGEGGYQTEEVGPFCSSCWEYLRSHFDPTLQAAPAATPDPKEREADE